MKIGIRLIPTLYTLEDALGLPVISRNVTTETGLARIGWVDPSNQTRKKQNLVFFTGAGINQESGIKTFRDTGGLWETHTIEEVASPIGWKKSREKVLGFANQQRADIIAANIACAEAEKVFNVTIVTQNIDDLHERAGSTNVIHLHGEILKAQSSHDPNIVVPIIGPNLNIGDKCPKGSQLRPHVVWFTEPVLRYPEAKKAISEANIVIVCGTSLSVMPAAQLIENTQPSTKKILVDPDPPTQEKLNRQALFNWEIIPEKASSGITKALQLCQIQE